MTYNTRSPAVKRLMKEAQELSESTELFYAKPLDDNLFEWHFTIRGPEETDFSGGIYHGRIILPAEYPMKPPNILLMTPSGRFEVNRKICLSISGYHPETWRPSWSIRTALLAIIGFMPTHGVGAIGSLEYPPEERRKLAKNSENFICPQCGEVKGILKSLTEASVEDVKEAMNLATQIIFTGDKEGETKVERNSEIKEELNNPDQMIKGAVDSATSPLTVLVNTVSSSVNSPLVFPQGNIRSMQPLSFEEWCTQMKLNVTQEKSKGDDLVSSQPSSTQATAGSCVTEISSLQSVHDCLGTVISPILNDDNIETITDSTSDSPEIIPQIQESLQSTPSADHIPLLNVSSPFSSSLNQPSSQNVVHSPSIPSATVTPVIVTSSNNISNMEVLLRRQSILLQCMAVVGGILGLFLAVRLGSLGSGMINK